MPDLSVRRLREISPELPHLQRVDSAGRAGVGLLGAGCCGADAGGGSGRRGGSGAGAGSRL